MGTYLFNFVLGDRFYDGHGRYRNIPFKTNRTAGDISDSFDLFSKESDISFNSNKSGTISLFCKQGDRFLTKPYLDFILSKLTNPKDKIDFLSLFELSSLEAPEAERFFDWMDFYQDEDIGYGLELFNKIPEQYNNKEITFKIFGEFAIVRFILYCVKTMDPELEFLVLEDFPSVNLNIGYGLYM